MAVTMDIGNPESQVFNVNITCDSKNAHIHFTKDGSEPGINSPLYFKDFSIIKTTKIRARAFIDSIPSVIISEKMFNFHLGLGKDIKLMD